MKATLEKYLKENIDPTVAIKQWEDQEKLPLFLLETYSCFHMTILGEDCVLMAIIDEVPTIDAILKHMRVIKKNYTGSLVLGLKTISTYKRKSLIEQRIPFLIENGQMYLPFLGLDLKKETNRNISASEKFSATGQLVYLLFLYNRETQINATELAKRLNVTMMTASRALKELHALGLLTYQIVGKNERSKIYQRIDDPEYYRRGNAYLKNPIKKVVYLEAIPDKYPIAGLEALANQSMINNPKWPIRAISKETEKMLAHKMVSDKDELFNKDCFEVQVWQYNPDFLSDHNQVDKLSLAISFNDIKDDRIDQAIQEMLEGEQWYRE